MAIRTYLLIIALNVNEASAPIKRHKDSIFKNEFYLYVTPRDLLQTKDTYRLKVRG